MLIRQYKVDDRIQVGEVELVIVAIDRGQVKLGVNAPRQMNIVREELIVRVAVDDPEAQRKPA